MLTHDVVFKDANNLIATRFESKKKALVELRPKYFVPLPIPKFNAIRTALSHRSTVSLKPLKVL